MAQGLSLEAGQPYPVDAKTRHLAFYLSPAGVAQRDHGQNRANADGHSQHRQHGAGGRGKNIEEAQFPKNRIVSPRLASLTAQRIGEGGFRQQHNTLARPFLRDGHIRIVAQCKVNLHRCGDSILHKPDPGRWLSTADRYQRLILRAPPAPIPPPRGLRHPRPSMRRHPWAKKKATASPVGAASSVSGAPDCP